MPQDIEPDGENPSASQTRADYTPPDCGYWARCDFWTPKELAALSLGYDPNVIEYYAAKHRDPLDNVQIRYSRVCELAFRSVQADNLPSRISPEVGLEWLQHKRLTVSDDLLQCVDEYLSLEKPNETEDSTCHDSTSRNSAKAYTSDYCAANDNQLANPKSQKSKNILIATLAIQGYGYDPRKKRTNIIAEIVDDIIDLGLNMTDDTVRAHLKEACEMVDHENLKDKD